MDLICFAGIKYNQLPFLEGLLCAGIYVIHFNAHSTADGVSHSYFQQNQLRLRELNLCFSSHIG